MSLGTTGLSGFRPKASSTAAQLIKVAPSNDRTKKETTLQIRISEDVLLLFKEICDANNIKMSVALRKYIDDVASCGFGALPLERAAQNCNDDLSLQNVRTATEYKAQQTPAGGKVSFKNNDERRAWLGNYKDWGVWISVPEVNKTFYRFDFINGCTLIVETGSEYYDEFYSNSDKPQEWKMYSILDGRRKVYDSSGVSYTYVIDWLQKHAKEI